MGPLLLVLLLSTALAPAGSNSDYIRAAEKIDLIVADRAPGGSTISLSSEEINAYARGELAKAEVEGIRDTKVELGEALVTASALVDFARLSQARGGASGWLVSRLLSGEQPVSVTVRVQSKGGQARVDIERVEISGLQLEGDMLDLLVDNFFLARYPDAVIGEPFELEHNIEEIRVRPARVDIKIGG